MKIRVTRDEIDRGDRYRSRSCPVALAVSKVLKEGVMVTVGPNYFTVFGKMEGASICEVIKFGQEVAEFIRDFDGGEKVYESEFEVNIPNKYLNT